MACRRTCYPATGVLIACMLFARPAVRADESPADTASRIASEHWSFRSVQCPDPPTVAQSEWVRNPIDAFVLARLEAAGIEPSPEADRTTLLRRLCLDLTGLPASTESLENFLSDSRPGAYERLVDRLLASPHFGERWGHHWLDLARYADSDGYEMDYARPNAWRWRDWVVAAFNSDMPYDQFTLEQLAGDLLPGATWSQQLATGFHRNTPTNTENGIDEEEFRVKAVVDRVNTTGTVWLGLTIACAECHDHKYDPIEQTEFYNLFAFFNDRVDEADIPVEPTSFDRAALIAAQRRHEDEIGTIEAELQSATGADREELAERLAELKESEPQLTAVAAGFRARSAPRASHVLLRGDFLDRGPRVPPDVPAVLPPLNRAGEVAPGRLDLAHWLIDGGNPLTARVEANRIWQQLFGVGLVTTPGDFGTQGDPPSHPSLLDRLAAELMRRDWSRKDLVRLIVTSAVYRQASATRNDLAEIDPANRLLARQNRFRLKAEFLRDQYLAAGGLLNRQIGGPGFHPPLPAGLSQIGFKVAWTADPVDQQYRRGVYIVTRRNLAVPMLTTFDRPDANVTCVLRERSNTPLQSLTQMNDPLLMDCARALALRVTRAGDDVRTRIRQAVEICLSRPASGPEIEALTALQGRTDAIYRSEPEAAATLVDRTESAIDAVELAPWIIVARTIMNLDEFVTRE